MSTVARLRRLSNHWPKNLFKGIVHPKIKILSLITHPHVVFNLHDLCSSSEHKLRYFWLNLRALCPSHRQQKQYFLFIYLFINILCAKNTITIYSAILLVEWIFVFFVHKKYFCSFVKLWLNSWCQDYFTDVLATLLDLGTFQLCCCLWEGQRALGLHQKYLNLCSEDEWRVSSPTTWGRVINDRIFISGWTIPLSKKLWSGDF